MNRRQFLQNVAAASAVALGRMEDIRQGERIRKYRIEGLTGPDTWQSLCEGQSVGHKRIERFGSIEVAKLRLRTLDSVGEPLIRELAAYHVG